MVLCRMAFCLSGKMVALHLNNSIAKTYLCNQGGTVSPFLCRLACRYCLTNKHSITLILAYIPTHLNVQADYQFQSQLLWEWHLLQIAQVAFHLWSQPGGYTGILPYHSMPALLHLGNTTTSGGLGAECLQPSLDVSGKLCFSSCIGPLVLSKFLMEHVKGQPRHLILVASCWMEVPWLPTVLHMLTVILWHCPIIKRSCHRCFGRPCAQESAKSAFNPLAVQRCVLGRQGFSSSVCQALSGATQVFTMKVYQQCWMEWAGWYAQEGVPNNAISTPKLADFFVNLFRVGLAWHTVGIYHSAFSVFLKPHHLHKASNHSVISKLMSHFYLHYPPSCKHFDLWDVEHSLSLLESWALASSHTTFKLVWKTATGLELDTVKVLF